MVGTLWQALRDVRVAATHLVPEDQEDDRAAACRQALQHAEQRITTALAGISAADIGVTLTLRPHHIPRNMVNHLVLPA